MSDFKPPSDDRDPDAIRRLHARYDGVIPVALRAAALAGGGTRLARLKAEARRRMFAGLARDSLSAVAARRRRLAGARVDADGILDLLARDLRFYRDRGVERL